MQWTRKHGREKNSLLIKFYLMLVLFLAGLPSPAQLKINNGQLSPIKLNQHQDVEQGFGLLSQNPSVVPTDVTPFQLNRERETYAAPNFKFRVFQKLPASLWFSAVTEETLRWETNVYQTATRGKNDLVFRTLPNVTVGYAFGEHTNIYSNYFMIKDLYATHAHDLNPPTTTSVSMGIRRDFPIKSKTTLQLDMQARELWQEPHLRQADLLPAINLTRTLTPNAVLFGSVLLQMRSRELFQGPTRELDPFYSLGIVMRHGDWNFVVTDTYVTNFREPPFRGSIPQEGNLSMIVDFEASHPLSKKIPDVVAFLRAEPIYNWRSHFIAGQSGYDFRLYGGLRFTISKPAYNAQINQLRKHILESEKEMTQSREKNSGASSEDKDRLLKPAAP